MAISSYSTTAADNTSISGIAVTDSTVIDAVDDIIRQLMADIKTFYDDPISLDTTPQLGGPLDSNDFSVEWSKGADVASATEILVLRDGNYFTVTGNITITDIETTADAWVVGSLIVLHCTGTPLWTHHATKIILPDGVNIQSVAGDIFMFQKVASGSWRLVSSNMLATATNRGLAVAATTTVAGVVERSTSAENITGTSDTVYPTVAGAKEIVDTHVPAVLNATGTAPIYGCRAFGYIDASSGTPTLVGSGNVTLTDTAEGDIQVNFITAMPNATYAVVGSSKKVDDNGAQQADRTLFQPYALTTSNFKILTVVAEGGVSDCEIVMFAVFG